MRFRSRTLTLEADLTITTPSTPSASCSTPCIPATPWNSTCQVGEMDTAGFRCWCWPSAKLSSRTVASSAAAVIEFYNMTAFFGDPLVIPAAERQ
jgi:hypothetical protein